MPDKRMSVRRSPRTHQVMAAALAAAGISAAIVSTVHTHVAISHGQYGFRPCVAVAGAALSDRPDGAPPTPCRGLDPGRVP